MVTDNNKISPETISQEMIDDVSTDLINLFSSNKEYFTKSDCKNLLNIIFEALFDEKLKNNNFNYIYNLLSKDSNKYITKNDIEPIIRALIVCFDVNFITNSNSFNDKVCIKIGKHLLPNSYYIKKSTD
jgi:hypothetical protein